MTHGKCANTVSYIVRINNEKLYIFVRSLLDDQHNEVDCLGTTCSGIELIALLYNNNVYQVQFFGFQHSKEDQIKFNSHGYSQSFYF